MVNFNFQVYLASLLQNLQINIIKSDGWAQEHEVYYEEPLIFKCSSKYIILLKAYYLDLYNNAIA